MDFSHFVSWTDLLFKVTTRANARAFIISTRHQTS